MFRKVPFLLLMYTSHEKNARMNSTNRLSLFWRAIKTIAWCSLKNGPGPFTKPRRGRLLKIVFFFSGYHKFLCNIHSAVFLKHHKSLICWKPAVLVL